MEDLRSGHSVSSGEGCRASLCLEMGSNVLSIRLKRRFPVCGPETIEEKEDNLAVRCPYKVGCSVLASFSELRLSNLGMSKSVYIYSSKEKKNT